MSDPVQPRRRQPTRLPCSWDSPGKNTGVGCHFHLQCMKVKRESDVAQSCPTLSDPTDCNPPGSSLHGILQARVLEWGAIAFSASWERQKLIGESRSSTNLQLSLEDKTHIEIPEVVSHTSSLHPPPSGEAELMVGESMDQGSCSPGLKSLPCL